jgi:hypothetical protein
MLIIYEKNWEYNEAVHQFFKECNKVYDSIRKEIRLNILTECGIYMKQVRLIKCVPMKRIVMSEEANLCLVHSLFRMVCSNERFIATAFKLCFRMSLEGFKQTRRDRNKMGHIRFGSMLIGQKHKLYTVTRDRQALLATKSRLV